MSLLVSRRGALYEKSKASNKGFGLQLILYNSILSLLIYNMLSTYQSLHSPHEVNTLRQLVSSINKFVCVCVCVHTCKYSPGVSLHVWPYSSKIPQTELSRIYEQHQMTFTPHQEISTTNPGLKWKLFPLTSFLSFHML